MTPNKMKTAEIKIYSYTEDKEVSWRSFFYEKTFNLFMNMYSESPKPFYGGDINSNTVVSSNIELLLENPLPTELLKTNNKFDAPLKGKLPGSSKKEDNTVANIINTIDFGLQFVDGYIKGNAGRVLDPWISNMKTWSGISSSSEIKFDYTFEFRMGQYGLWNAKEEVVLPILNLMTPTLLSYVGTLYIGAPYPTTPAVLGLITEDLFTGDLGNDDGLKGFLEALVKSGWSNNLYKVRLGQYYLDAVTIEDSAIKWSQETDQDGFPIAGSITLTFSMPFGQSLFTKSNVPQTVKFSPSSSV